MDAPLLEIALNALNESNGGSLFAHIVQVIPDSDHKYGVPSCAIYTELSACPSDPSFSGLKVCLQPTGGFEVVIKGPTPGTALSNAADNAAPGTYQWFIPTTITRWGPPKPPTAAPGPSSPSKRKRDDGEKYQSATSSPMKVPRNEDQI